MQLEIDGIPVRVEKKRIKNMHLYVKPPAGTVLLTAPSYVSNVAIEQFARSKADWIKKSVARFEETPETKEPSYSSGEIVPVWGEYATLQVVSGRPGRVEWIPDGETPVLRMTAPEGADTKKKEKLLTEWYRSELIERTDILLPRWEEYTGLRCSAWHPRNMRARWGSCNTRTGEITLNVQLAKHPVECLEYVILHELCHTVVPNHGPEFKALETKYMPEWRQVRNRLNGRL